MTVTNVIFASQGKKALGRGQEIISKKKLSRTEGAQYLRIKE